MRGWKYPTEDSPQIRVRDLLNHAAGFVTDDPWGDRQTPLPEDDFTRLLRDGVPFTSVPDMRYEYSNLGYAILGRIISNVSRQPYPTTITRTLLQPLGMKASGFVADDSPRDQRALGYRWEDDAWRLEPTLGPGAFGAMGGLQTNANDYAKWVTFLLSAWPPRDGADSGPVRRATVRELVQGSNFPRLRDRAARTAPRQPPVREHGWACRSRDGDLICQPAAAIRLWIARAAAAGSGIGPFVSRIAGNLRVPRRVWDAARWCSQGQMLENASCRSARTWHPLCSAGDVPARRFCARSTG
jgi:CubicO group peptidase (beta-lactamase class C family)